MHHSIDNLCAGIYYSHPVDTITQLILLQVVGMFMNLSYNELMFLIVFRSLHDEIQHTSARIELGLFSRIIVAIDIITHITSLIPVTMIKTLDLS